MVIKITKKSLVQFQFGDTEPIITIDAIEVSDMWHEINFALRKLEGEMWILPTEKVNEFAVNRLNFVQEILASAYAIQHPAAPVPNITRLEAEEFVKQVQMETERLRNFTSQTAAESSSAPESTVPDSTFSQ